MKRKLILEQIEVESFDTSPSASGISGTVMGHQQRDDSNLCDWTDEWNGGCRETGITVFCDPNCGDTVYGPTWEWDCDTEDPTEAVPC